MSYTITDQFVLQNIWNAAVAEDWQLAYQLILDALTDPSTGNPLPELPDSLESVYVWIEGAKKVNANDGAFATYIRDYTVHQYQLRTGETPTDMADRLQSASDILASKFVSLFLYGTPDGNFSVDGVPSTGIVPELHTIGLEDGAAAADLVFSDASSSSGTNYSPWAGTILFTDLGDGSFFRDWMLNPGTTGQKLESGTYDLISAARVTLELKSPLALWDTFVSNEFGTYLYSKILGWTEKSTNISAANQFLQNMYGGEVWVYNIGDSIFDDSVGSIQPEDMYRVGTINDDKAANAIVLTSANAMVHAGAGDDDVRATSDWSSAIARSGLAVLDGGDGYDRLDYSQLATPVVVRFDNEGAFGWRGEVRKSNDAPLGPRDLIFNFEEIKLTDQADVVITMDGVTIPGLKLDLGGGDNIAQVAAQGGLEIRAGSGNDSILVVGSEGAIIYGGAGNDVIWTPGSTGAVIHTGTGEDTVGWSPGVFVADADGQDRIAFFGGELDGAIKSGGSESPWAYALNGLIKVGFNSAGEMVIGTGIYSVPGDTPGGASANYMYLANGNSDPFAASADLTAGIRVAETETNSYRLLHLPDNVKLSDNAGIWEFMALTVKEFFADARVAGSDPLVLDLDGDGLELTAESAVAPMFDVDGDMFAEPTGWVGADDGLLAIDLNSNGMIDDVSELFGSADQSGFAALAAYDSNADGVIDANDTLFGGLRIWQDLNQNGVTDAGELTTLAAHDIVSIGLAATDDGGINALNTVVRTGTFTRGDATTGTVGDIEFRVDNFNMSVTGHTRPGAMAA